MLMPQCSGICPTVANKTTMPLRKMRRMYVVVPIERHMELCTPPILLNGVRPVCQNVLSNASKQVRHTGVHVAQQEDSVQVRDAESAVDSHVTQRKAIGKHDLGVAHRIDDPVDVLVVDVRWDRPVFVVLMVCTFRLEHSDVAPNLSAGAQSVDKLGPKVKVAALEFELHQISHQPNLQELHCCQREASNPKTLSHGIQRARRARKLGDRIVGAARSLGGRTLHCSAAKKNVLC